MSSQVLKEHIETLLPVHVIGDVTGSRSDALVGYTYAGASSLAVPHFPEHTRRTNLVLKESTLPKAIVKSLISRTHFNPGHTPRTRLRTHFQLRTSRSDGCSAETALRFPSGPLEQAISISTSQQALRICRRDKGVRVTPYIQLPIGPIGHRTVTSVSDLFPEIHSSERLFHFEGHHMR